MEFIILSPELNNPRESYSFDLDYPEDENDHGMTFSGTKVTNVESTKGQLVKLIRSLIQFSNTLEELPKERVINIKVSVCCDNSYIGGSSCWLLCTRLFGYVTLVKYVNRNTEMVFALLSRVVGHRSSQIGPSTSHSVLLWYGAS